MHITSMSFSLHAVSRCLSMALVDTVIANLGAKHLKARLMVMLGFVWKLLI